MYLATMLFGKYQFITVSSITMAFFPSSAFKPSSALILIFTEILYPICCRSVFLNLLFIITLLGKFLDIFS